MTETDQPIPGSVSANELPASVSDAPPADEASAGGISKVGDIKTVEELIAYAYQQNGKRFTVSGQVFETIARRPTSTARDEEEHVDEAEHDDEAEHGDGDGDDVAEAEMEDPALELVLKLADQDPQLAVPPRLLIEIEDGKIDAALRKHLLLLLTAVLKRHAIFRDDALQDALLTAPADRNAVFDALRSAAARVRADDLSHPERPVNELKTNEREKLASNAVTSLALLLSLRDRWTTEEFAECLHTPLAQRHPRLPATQGPPR